MASLRWAIRVLARRAQVQFRFESTVMDGAPVFNFVRPTLPGVQIQGFTGCLNSTSKLIIEAMRRGLTLEQVCNRRGRKEWRKRILALIWMAGFGGQDGGVSKFLDGLARYTIHCEARTD